MGMSFALDTAFAHFSFMRKYKSIITDNRKFIYICESMSKAKENKAKIPMYFSPLTYPYKLI